MRRGTRIAAALGAVALAGLTAVGSAPEPGTASGRPAAAEAPAPPEFRLAYAATHRLTLAAAVPGAAPAGLPELADDAGADYDDYDADARGGALVWVGRRAPTGVAHVDGDIFLRAGAAPAARLTDEPATERHPALSPDGRLVAFTSDRGGSNDVWVIGADGAGPRRVTDHPGDDQWPTWSPDGRRLAFVTRR
ncbi:MAG TPA: hypothetical protein VES42_23890, partial [Pilimelia sp.]|nr:hypothetical protein [Pilimelia sp.]